jgi:hypothetical protein
MLDLGALLSGLSRGMGQYSDIQFAERLQREAEARKFAQQRQLAQEAFDRRKELEMILADRKWDRSMRDKAYFQRWDDVAAQGAARAEEGGAERIARIMQGYGKPYDLDEEYKRSQIDANEALAEYRRSGGGRSSGGTGQDGAPSDAQTLSIVKAGEALRAKLEGLRREYQKELRGMVPPHIKEGIQDELEALTDEDIDRQVKALESRLRGAFGGGMPEAPGLDVRSIIEDEVGKAQ